MVQPIANIENCEFIAAYQEFDVKRLIVDIEAKEKLTFSQQRNLSAIILGVSPKDAALRLGISEASLKPAFSMIYRLIEQVTQQPHKTVTYKNASVVLVNYRQGSNITLNKKFDLLGRDVDRQKLEDLSRQAKIVLIKAGAGMGKSTLAREFLQTQFKKVIRIEMGLESGNVTPAEEKVSQILRKDFDEKPSRDFGINLDILREKLADRANPIGILIDNLEPALDENYRFREKLRGYDALLAVLGDRDVFSFTLITSRLELIIPRAKVHLYPLKGLDIKAWQQYFHDYENGADSEALLLMRDAYNGNAKVMDILHGAMKNRFDGNIGAYWSRYKDALLADSELETLISVEMDWLRDNQPDAYKLLCRMGCYRYQDVKTVPFEGLICLLWDVPESRQVWVVDYLSKSSLISIKEEYYLHPAIRENAKLRLLLEKVDWEISNRKVAIFWTNSVKSVETVDDALRAFEAYHHYLAIDDVNSACETIIKERENKWVKYVEGGVRIGESLGYSYLMLGLLEPMILAIQCVIPRTDHQLILPIACNLLGDLLWLTGKIHMAISYHEKTDNIVVNALENHPHKHLYSYHYSSVLNRGLCYLALWEVEKAHNFFLDMKNELFNVISGKDIKDLKRHIFWSNFCLAFTYSLINDIPNTLLYIEFVSDQPETANDTWIRGYSLLFIAQAYKNIRFFKNSNAKYQEAIKFANDSAYSQVKAIALCGLGEIERLDNQYTSSLSYIQTAVEILQKISAAPDLAEAYFQLGLTYQAMEENDQAEEYKVKALKLFAQMEAPKQIERVNKAFEQGAKK
jgi:tetratricopeptide (TPR) repeat protein